MKQKANRRGHHPHYAGEQHDRGERAAVNGGTFHQGADGLQIFFGPVRIHGVTLHHKAEMFKRNLEVL